MICSDMHTHSDFSDDGRSTLLQMVEGGKRLALRFLGLSEHLDVDALSEKLYRKTDLAAYFRAAREQQREAHEGFTLLAGLECGYSDEPRALETLLLALSKYEPDFVVNSVHVVDGQECSRPEYFSGKNRQTAYRAYLEKVLKSLDAPYRYDVVGHLGYVSRRAPYADKVLRYDDFPALFDELLRGIIARGKLLEVNTNTRETGEAFLPGADILARYHRLGGRLISFGSDAHDVTRIGAGREAAERALTQIGFSSVAVPAGGRVTLLPLR